MKVLAKTKLEELFNKLGESAELYVPMGRGTDSGFYSWKTYDASKDELMLDALNVTQSAKKIVFPQTEKMYSIKGQGQEMTIEETFEDSSPTIIFGIRACDSKAIFCLDQVFLTKGYVDNFYKARRDNTLIIANACYNPGANCFCGAMDVDPTEPDNADIIIRDAGEVYIWEAKTEKGESLSSGISALLEEKDVKVPELKPFKTNVNYEGVAEKLQGMFEHAIWDRLSEQCQNCGICTYVCPSCHCFDIQVKMWGDEGYRFRTWDSCMYTEYSAEAGGGNPRATGKERFRNRFLHKLEFFTERYGRPLCTGCGRCISVCPNGVNIINIIDEIKEADEDV